jgi:Transposase zinc-ribbon domain
MEAPKALQEAILYFADFENCKTFMVSLRWPDGLVKCPRCGSEKVTWLAKARIWKCYAKHETHFYLEDRNHFRGQCHQP